MKEITYGTGISKDGFNELIQDTIKKNWTKQSCRKEIRNS